MKHVPKRTHRLDRGERSNEYVLASRLPTTALEGTSRYGDETWHLKPAERLGNVAALSLRFEVIPEQFREACKQLFAQLLSDDLQPAGYSYGVSTIRVFFTGVSNFLRYLESAGIDEISRVGSAELARYVGYLAGQNQLHEASLRACRLFWIYRHRLSAGLHMDPALLPFWRPAKMAKARVENSTSRIPEAVLEPLIWWSARFVLDLAPDILQARADYRELRSRREAMESEENGGPRLGDKKRQLLQLLEKYEASGERLPGHSCGTHYGQVNFSAIDREAGVSTGCAVRMVEPEVRRLVKSNGLELGTFLSTTTTGQLGGALWRDKITYGEVPLLLRNLHIASYILIAFFSGMRETEIKNLRRNCIKVDQDPSGMLRRVYLEGAVFKGNQLAEGRAATWVVGPIVEHAVAVLESLIEPDADYLFVPLRDGTSHAKRIHSKLITQSETTRAMESFVSWVNDYASSRPNLQGIPDIDGKRWRITSRQFRRTLAWFIARRPGGVAAGALQYKHLSLEMFRGYAGESESGFAMELAAEKALARGEWLEELSGSDEPMVGRAHDELIRRLEARGKALGFVGQLPDSPRQLLAVLKRHEPHVYRGSAVTCVFDPAKALCQMQKADTPDLRTCQPTKCGNAVFSSEDLLSWRRRAEELRVVANDDSMAPAVQHRASEEANRLEGFLRATDRNEQCEQS